MRAVGGLHVTDDLGLAQAHFAENVCAVQLGDAGGTVQIWGDVFKDSGPLLPQALDQVHNHCHLDEGAE